MLDRLGRRGWGALFVTLGVTLAAAGLTFWFAWGLPETRAYNQVVLGIVVHVLFGYIVVMSGVMIYRSDLAVAECLLAAKWCFGGFLLMGGFVVWAAAPELRSGDVSLAFLNQFVVVGSVGAAAGVLIGLNRGQAAQNRRLIDEKEDQRETLLFVLRLLRHDLRNDLMVINGFTDGLKGDLDSEAERERVECIEDRTETAKQLLETVDVIIESETGQLDIRPFDVAPVVHEQVDIIRSTSLAVDIETDIQDGLQVQGNDFLGEVFKNILDNAVQHNDPESLTVRVTARRVGDDVEIEFRDDGSGIPPEIRKTVFEPSVQRPDSNGDGLGLYLVRKLVESCNGSVSVAERKPGTSITVRLPSA